MAGQRPGGVTLVAVIAWINGLFTIISGIFHIFSWAGWASIVIGIITIAVSLGLFRGSNGARTIMAIVFVIGIAVAIAAFVSGGSSLWAVIGSSLLPLIGLILLYSPKASAYFS
ncbi:hypothetical protein [Microbacterium sp. 2FI]|uniref:hypothetical protein n=1 Tax=Microbacterium sp. 2FI TaxID=2502193 RepID=UPI0010F97406|nr:hypothetical protein [Microbacterium sp. 2FI]